MTQGNIVGDNKLNKNQINFNTAFALLLTLLITLSVFPYNTGGVLAADYRLVNEWGTFGGEIGQFNEPADIAFDPISGDIFVSDLKNNRIQKFDSNGNYLMSWGMPGTRPGQFQHPAT